MYEYIDLTPKRPQSAKAPSKRRGADAPGASCSRIIAGLISC